MARGDLLLHPVRLRIIKSFMGNRELTTSQLAEELPDVPPGSLYRHVGLLAKAGVLKVVAERRVRGSVERTFALLPAAARIQPGEVAAMTLDEHRHAFDVFIASLLADFDRYVTSNAAHLGEEGAGYHLTGLWLTQPEYEQLVEELIALIRRRQAAGPGSGRRRWFFYGVAMPEPDGKPAARDRKGPTSPDQSN
ncbi:MAG TPA: helix-turn-helix domain-containing protein [Thermomicrobiaceae bacterium]|nr:helix-turn-helix domain-containing protein [Thermomicrobiaceae bacterium]